MLTTAGSGYSRWRDIAITRWREDTTRDCWGSYIFLRDAQTGEVWSTGYQPSGVEPDAYEVSFHEDRAEFIRRDRSVTTTLDIVVSPEDDAEVRRVSITNLGTRAREILTEFTPALLEALGDSGDPDLALLTFDKFLSEVPTALQLFSMLRANPNLLRLLAQIMGSAPRLARALDADRKTACAVDADHPIRH